MAITVDGLKAALTELAEKNEWDENDFWYEPGYYLKEPTEVKAEVVTVEIVETQTGGEDVFPADGGEIYVIFKVSGPSGDQYFKKAGWYQSYIGSQWKDFYEVKPKQKTITVFEKD